MAVCGYLLLLTCILGHLPLELARLPEGKIVHGEVNHRQPSQVSMMGHRSEPPPRLHGGHPKKVLPFPEAEQQLMRRRRGSRILYPVGDEDLIIDEDAMAGHRQYYLPRPPSRMHPHVYQDPVHHGEEEIIRGGPREVIIPESSFGVTPHIYQGPVFRNEWNMNRERSQSRNRMPHYESFEEVFTDLEDEKMRQASKHHNTDHGHEHKHQHEQKHERGPTVERNNYWIIGQKRFRMIVLIILAVIVGFIILLILAWFFCPKKYVKKISRKK